MYESIPAIVSLSRYNHRMPNHVTLVGLDFGTTTSSAVIATALLLRSGVTGRTELGEFRERFRSEPVFTPFRGDRLDEMQVARLVDEWLAAGNVSAEGVFGGGAILTGLAAQAENAAALVQLIRARLHDALIATADDPCFESWLAFMGSCAAMSRTLPATPILNLDIGGGTTNLALGRDGQVLRTGCLFVGARHLQVVPGSYRIVKMSPYAQALLQRLGISRSAGQSLDDFEVEAFVNFQVQLIEAAVSGNAGHFLDPLQAMHQQVAFTPPAYLSHPVVTFSGGVGELIYAHAAGLGWPATTKYGDLGIELARRIAASPALAGDLQRHRPESGGRATVYGLLRHNTEVSGTSLFLSRPTLLPLPDLPILGAVTPATSDPELEHKIELVRRSTRGGCLQVELGSPDATVVRAVGQRLASRLRAMAFPSDRPLVLLVRENVGKLLGSYITEWGALPLSLGVIDEISLRDARFAQIGAPRHQVVPVSFYGFSGERDASASQFAQP